MGTAIASYVPRFGITTYGIIVVQSLQHIQQSSVAQSHEVHGYSILLIVIEWQHSVRDV